MASKDIDDVRVDIMHVSTYLPLIILLLRAAVFLTTMQVVAIVVGQMHMIVVVSAWIVYFDACLFRNDASNCMSGFLIPAALMYCNNRLIAVQFEIGCTFSSTTLLTHFVLAVTWATCSMFMLVYVFVDMPQLRLELHIVSIFSGALGISMLWTECSTKSFHELLFRGILYYIFTFGFYLMHAFTQHLHRRRYKTIGMHIFLHLLFVNAYVIAGSILMSFTLIVYLIQKISSAKSEHMKSNEPTHTFTGMKSVAQLSTMSINLQEDIVVPTSPNENKKSYFPDKDSEENALKELMAAKRALNMV
jgi:hypothetical protein